MKINPGQSLILAGEYPPPRGPQASALEDVMGAAARGSILTRVTVLAARPDSSVVMMRADYSPRTGTDGALDAAPQKNSAGALVPLPVAARSLPVLARNIGRKGISSYLKPTEQYARTQSRLDEAPLGVHIDVLA